MDDGGGQAVEGRQQEGAGEVCEDGRDGQIPLQRRNRGRLREEWRDAHTKGFLLMTFILLVFKNVIDIHSCLSS